MLTSLLGLLQLGALTVRLVRHNIDETILLNLVILVLCYGLYQMRRWALWLIMLALSLFSFMQVLHTPEPFENFIYNALPVLMVVLACTVPHYEKMRW